MFQFQRFVSQDFYLSMMRSDGNASYGSLPSIRNMLEQQINEYNTALAEYNNINNDVTSKKLLKSGDGLLKAYDDYFRENPTADRTEFDNFKLGFEPWKQAYQPPTTAMPTTPNETYVDMNDPRFQRQMEQAAAEAVGSGNYGATPADIGNLGNGAPAGGTAPTATTEATVDNRPRSDKPYDPAPNIDSEGNPYTPIAEGPQTTPKAPARNELTKSEEKEIEQNIKSLYAANPDNKVGFFTRNFSDFSNGTTEKATERLQKAYKEVDEATINKMKIANVNFPKQAAEAALAGDNRLDTFIKKEQSKLDFVQDYINALDKPINKNQAKELANAADRFIDPKQKGDVAVDTKGVIKFVKKFQEQNKDDKGKQLDFPINLVTDRKNAPMLQLAAKNPELAATAIEAFKAQGKSKGLTAYKAVDLGTGIEIAMGAANKQADPESKKLAAKNVANLVMNDAASIGFFTGKAKLDDKKIKAIEKGLKSEPKPLKSVPDTKEGRLTQAASNAAKYPKVYAALTAAMSKDGKTKVTNRDLNKAFEALGPKANILEKSAVSADTIKNALSAKAAATNHLSSNAKKEYIINKEKEPKIKELINNTSEFKNLSSEKKTEVQKILTNLTTDGTPDVKKTKDAVAAIKGIVGGNATLASSLTTQAGEIDREARQNPKLDKKVESQFKDTAETTVAENLVKGSSALLLNDLVAAAEKSNLEKKVGTKIYQAVVESIEAVGAKPSLQAIQNVMSGLGSGTIKALQASNVSTDEIKSTLLMEGAGKTTAKEEQKSTKLIQDLAGDNQANRDAAKSKDPKELEKAEKALSAATGAASQLHNLAVKKINEQGGEAVAALTQNASNSVGATNARAATAAQSHRGSISL